MWTTTTRLAAEVVRLVLCVLCLLGGSGVQAWMVADLDADLDDEA